MLTFLKIIYTLTLNTIADLIADKLLKLKRKKKKK